MEKNANPWMDWLANWPEMQREMYRQWVDALDKLPGLKPDVIPGFELPKAADVYGQWLDYLKELVGKFPAAGTGDGPEVFARMLSSAETYTRLYSWWMDLYRDLQKAAEEGESSSRAFDDFYHRWSAGYEEMVKGIFAAAMPESLQWAAELVSGEVPRLAMDEAIHFWSPWFDYYVQSIRKLTQGGQPTTETITQAYEDWHSAYQKSFGRIARMPAMGYYRESVEKYSKAMDSLADFGVVLADFYASVANAGRQGMQKLQERLAEATAAGDGGPTSFRELYRVWWQTNEEIYIELFRTEEFSRLLGELVGRGMNFRENYQAYLEEVTKELPFPNRSEMDSLYKTVYDLRKEVRRLKREVAELRGGAEPALASAAPARKTTAKKQPAKKPAAKKQVSRKPAAGKPARKG